MYSSGSGSNQIITKWLAGSLERWSQSKISALVSADERKAFSNASSVVRLSEREPVQCGPCLALFLLPRSLVCVQSRTVNQIVIEHGKFNSSITSEGLIVVIVVQCTPTGTPQGMA